MFMRNYQCKITDLTQLSPSLWQLRLTPKVPFFYQAGQYVQIIIDQQDQRPFSIASAPTEASANLALHIGASPEKIDTWKVIAHLHQHTEITITAADGNAWLREDSQRPVLCMVGGTGFSYAHSLMTKLAEQQSKRVIQLYWGVRETSHFYLSASINSWQQKLSQFTYHPIVEYPHTDWQGRSGRVIDAVLADHIGLTDYDIYVAGRFEMAGAARQVFIEQGADPTRIFGDAYAFIKT